MVLKKKAGGTSSESSSSSSSSSSTSTSSSSNDNSGSDSSSSDSETSSTDRKSTDSETRRSRKSASPVKKKTPPRSNKPEPKVEPKPVNNVKSKNFPASKMSAIYSSESDDDRSKRRLSTSKGPKSSATVTPNVSKPTPKPKATASSTVNSKKIESKRLSSSSLKHSSTSKPEPKTKTKSIFSPDNSSESDTQTPPPPKLTPMKNITASSAAKNLIKSKLKSTPGKKESGSASEKSRTSSVSSRSSVSSESSSDSEESTPAPAVTPQKASPPPPKSSATVTPTSDSSSPKKKGRGRPRKNPLPNNEPKPGVVKKAAEPKAAAAPSPKKATRSGTTRTSKHLSGTISIKVQSDSESDSEKKKSALAKMKRPVGRPRKENGKKSNENLSASFPEEDRKCPVENCDSSGHLSGKFDTHFTKESCPVYHNLTPQQCKENATMWKKAEEDRRKALMLLKPSAMLLSAEQKAYREHVKEVRKELNEDARIEVQENIVPNPVIREPKFIAQGVPKFDYQLFLNAQAVAAEKIEADLKSLPCYKGTKFVEMGKFEMEVWYQSPYPEQFQKFPKLYLCEFCLKYMSSRTTLSRHTAKCVWKHPPGQQVYRKDKISVWEVDGKKYKQYCQNLCLLAKFFLDHKTLYYDVEPFLFYIMTTSDSEGCHTIGYFSKEKNSFLNYNVSCILTLPPYQRQGFGRLLIDFSYLLTRTENKVGSPEKPLSDLGLISYRSYWKDVLLEYLCNLENKQLSIKDMSQELAVNSYDIVSTLQALGMMKYWKGKHIILKKQDVIEEYVERVKRRGSNYKEIDAKCLKWQPPNTGDPS